MQNNIVTSCRTIKSLKFRFNYKGTKQPQYSPKKNDGWPVGADMGKTELTNMIPNITTALKEDF